MVSPRSSSLLVIVLLVALVSALLGHAIGANSAAPAAAPQALDTLAADLRLLASQLARLQGAIGKEPAPAAAAAPTPPREPAAEAAAATHEPAAGADATDEALQRLAMRLQQLETTGNATAAEWLQRAREQNPQPNQVAVAQLFEQLREHPDDQARRKGIERQVWLLGTKEVVQRFGMPSNIINSKDALGWEYWLPGGRQLTLWFRDGLVVRVDD